MLYRKEIMRSAMRWLSYLLHKQEKNKERRKKPTKCSHLNKGLSPQKSISPPAIFWLVKRKKPKTLYIVLGT